MKTPYHFKDVGIIAPVSITAIQGGNYNFRSLKDYLHATVVIRCGILTGAASAATLQQAKNVEGNGAKALAFTKYWYNVPGASPQDEQDLWQEVDAASNTFDVASSTNYRIEIEPAMLDVDNNFDCIRPHLSAPGTSLVACVYIEFHKPKFQGLGKKNMHSVAVN